MKALKRIVFYSKEDLSATYNLYNAEKLFENYKINEDLGVNDLLEFYNVKMFFDNKMYLPKWSEETKNKYSHIVKDNWNLLNKKLLQINDGNVIQLINELEFNYRIHFWDALNQLISSVKISCPKFENLLNTFKYHISFILQQKSIVAKFDKQIRFFLINSKEAVEILLSRIEEKQDYRNTPKFYFPKSLSLNDKENMVINYLNWENVNINYVRLIENSKDSSELKLSPKTRLKAKKKSQELNDLILINGNAYNVKLKVSFCKNQIEPIKYSKNGEYSISYSESFIDNLKDNLSLFYIYKKLFFFTDETNLITLVSKNNEVNTFEKIFNKSKNSYESSESYITKNLLSQLQFLVFENYLRSNNNSTENLINNFVHYLNGFLNPSKLIFSIQNSTVSYIEKIRNIFPEYDFLLKQYQIFVEEGEIDFELLRINSNPIRFSEMSSFSKNKYIYIESDLLSKLKYQFYSSQSMLYYIDLFTDKYDKLYDLLINENVKIDDFQSYQQNDINQLINDGYLKVNQQGYIKIKTEVLFYVIGEFHKKDVLNYCNYSKLVRAEIDKMIDFKLVKVENTLFTISERQYFNFIFNKKEFTNGLDLRNKYVHGTNSFSEVENKNDYFTILKLIILTLLKIEDDILAVQKKNL